MQKSNRKSFLNKVALSLIFSLGLFSLFSLLGTVKAEGEEIKPDEEAVNLSSTSGEQKDVFSHSGTFIVDTESGLPVASIAEIEISNVNIISQDGNDIEVAFKIKNHSSQVQPSIGYEIFLFSENRTSPLPAFNERGKVIYPEEINLKGKSVLTRNVKYVAPEYLKGSYSLLVKAVLSSGMTVGMDVAKDFVILEGDNKFVEIIPESCNLSIEGVALEKEFNIFGGIIVDSAKEKLIGSCKIRNHFDESVEFSPVFEVHYLSAFGGKAEYNQTEFNIFHVDPGEGIISFYLPTSMKPQKYQVEVFLKSQEEIISNSVFINYALKGVNATIQNITFDKPHYLKGETANVQLFWSGPADQFPGSRVEKTELDSLIAKISFSDKQNGQFCGQAIKEIKINSGEPPVISMKVPIVSDCENPIVLAILEGEDNEILFQQISEIAEKNGEKAFDSKKNTSMIILVSLSVFIVMIIIYLSVKGRKSKKINK